MQFSTRVKNARLNIIEATMGVGPTLKIRTGAKPASIDSASTGTVLASMLLPNDWMLDAAAGQKVKNGTWQDLAADADGVAGHYEIVAADGVVDERGSITQINGQGDMEIQSVNVVTGQTITVAEKTYIEFAGV
jgi:hypothetical protein